MKTSVEPGYAVPGHPPGSVTVEDLKRRLSWEHLAVLMQHALCLACLHGNAFGSETVEQYLPDAYNNLWGNSAVGGGGELPNLYMETAAQYYSARTEA